MNETSHNPVGRAICWRGIWWLAVTAAAALAVWLVLTREPGHDGLSLSEWLAGSAHAGPSDEEAAAALRAMGPRVIPALLGWLQTRESRWRARFRDWDARPGWFTVDTDPAWERRECAMAGFALLGTNAAPAIPRLAAWINDPEIGTAALGALRGIGPPSVSVFLTVLTNGTAEARNGVVQILGSEPFVDLSPGVPALVRALEDADYAVQLTAINTLGRCGRQPQVVWPALARRAQDTNFPGRAFALRALADGPSPVELALPVFIAALQDANVDARRAAVAGLVRVGGEAALEPLIRALEDRNAAVRSKAAVGLGNFTEHIERILPLLQERLTNDVFAVRGAAADGLSKFGPAARSVVPDLLALLGERGSMPWQLTLRNMAARALLKIDPEAAAQAGIPPDAPPPAHGRGRRGGGFDVPPPVAPAPPGP